MEFVEIDQQGDIAIVSMKHGKTNSLKQEVINDLQTAFDQIKDDEKINGVVLTGSGKFFSFGFDVPELLSYGDETFVGFLQSVTDCFRDIFVFPKPVVAALNGHAVAGGCMLAMACDYRILADGKRSIGLNEINIGAAVFAGSVEMLRYRVGNLEAQRILFTGDMYDAEQALDLGLVDYITDADKLMEEAINTATELANKQPAPFAQIKSLLKQPIVDEFMPREQDAIDRFVEIWNSPESQKKLAQVTIRK